MTALLGIFSMIGWRGVMFAALGAVFAGAAAMPLGRWAERQACAERIGRAIAERELQTVGQNNARIDAALAARRRADRDGFDIDDGGLPDDGFRRD